MKIEAEIKNKKKILIDDENFYQIPDYQRPYSWDKVWWSCLSNSLHKTCNSPSAFVCVICD